MKNKYKAYSEDKNNIFDVHYIDFINKGFGVQYGQSSDSIVWEYPENFILLQFTGLFDINERPIYEGDVITSGYISDLGSFVYESIVVYIQKDSCFGLLLKNEHGEFDNINDYERLTFKKINTKWDYVNKLKIMKVSHNIFENPTERIIQKWLNLYK